MIFCLFFGVEGSNPVTVTHFQFNSRNERGCGSEIRYNGWSMQNEIKSNEML